MRPHGTGILSPPTAVIANVRRVRIRNGRVFVDVFVPNSPQRWNDLPFVVAGGGASAWGYDPPTPDPQTIADSVPIGADTPEGTQVVLVLRGKYPPVIVGALQNTQATIAERTPVVDQAEDHPGDVGPADFARVNGGTRQILDSRGAWTLDLGDAEDPTARVQLPDDGVLRVSRGGEAAERLVLAGPLLAYLQQAQSYMEAMHAWLVVAAPALGASHGVPEFFGSLPSLTPEALKAAAIHVSADAEQGV
jgi:hypothetical protein